MTCLPTLHHLTQESHVVHVPTGHESNLHTIHTSQHGLHAPLRQAEVVVLHVLCQRISVLPVSPTYISDTRLHLASPAVGGLCPSTPLVHGERVEQLCLPTTLLQSVDFGAHQYGLRVVELELAITVHMVNGDRILLWLSTAL